MRPTSYNLPLTNAFRRRLRYSRPFCGLMSVLAVVIGLHVTSCDSGPRYIIGVSQCSIDIWRDKLNEELQMSTYTHDNVELRIVSAGDDSEVQIAQINRLVADGVDLLIVAPNQVSTITPALDRAYDAGIPVILIDRKTDSDRYTAFIGADNYAIGRLIARFAAADLGGQGRIVEILGLMSSSPAIERHRGFVDELARHPDISLVDTVTTDWTEADGERAMKRLLGRTRDFDFVFVHNDRMADGARRAMRRQGIGPEVHMAGVDALPVAGGGLEKVRDGELAASYIYPTRGDLVMQLALDILEGRPYQRETLLQSAIVTAENAEVMLLQADEMRQQSGRLGELHKQVSHYLIQARHQQVYLALSLVIIVLLAAFMLFAYRMWRMKRRMMEEATQAKLRFFTSVSHEFRTPLTLIADPVDRLLTDPDTTEGQRHLLTLVRKNVAIMLRLVGQVLDLRKAQNGKIQLNVSRVDLAQALREWTETFVPACERRGMTLHVTASNGLIAVTDRDKVESICYNLLSNALKHTPDGGQITVTLQAKGTDRFTLTVTDTGEGIPHDKLRHVFERFYQVAGVDHVGTGIGLALVKSFAEAMGGSVTVASEVEHGSTFTVTLPMMLASNTDTRTPLFGMTLSEAGYPGPATGMGADSPVPPAANTTSTANTATDTATDTEVQEILVVDDNEDICHYITYLLQGHYRVTCASNGHEGLEMAIQTVPDLIVSDVMMPVMDGTEMCRQIKQTTVTSHIPLLMLTASTLEEQRLRGYNCGADGYLTKPFKAEILLARIRNLLENRRILRDIFSQIGPPAPDAPSAGTKQTRSDAKAPTDPALPATLLPEQPASPSPDDRFVALLREKLGNRLSDADLSVETLSADMGMSRVQLYRKLKALTGLTPVELIRQTRLHRARQLIQQGGMTVSEVAYEVGFSSPSYFIKCYKELFGQTPNAKG